MFCEVCCTISCSKRDTDEYLCDDCDKRYNEPIRERKRGYILVRYAVDHIYSIIHFGQKKERS